MGNWNICSLLLSSISTPILHSSPHSFSYSPWWVSRDSSLCILWTLRRALYWSQKPNSYLSIQWTMHKVSNFYFISVKFLQITFTSRQSVTTSAIRFPKEVQPKAQLMQSEDVQFPPTSHNPLSEMLCFLLMCQHLRIWVRCFTRNPGALNSYF